MEWSSRRILIKRVKLTHIDEMDEISHIWDYIWMNMNFKNRNNDIDENDDTDDER